MIALPHLAHRRFAVVGLGKSGLSTARALLASGAEVAAWDDGEAGRSAAAAAGIPLAASAEAALDGAEALLLSPGIPHTWPEAHPAAARARALGLPIIGDIELLRQALPGLPLIAITGTNGKSTTTALIAHILRTAGVPVEVGGNLGMPVLDFDPPAPGTVLVIEMSSYQLELTPSLDAQIALLLNVTPDHLDRHGGMDGYIAAKRRIFDTQLTGLRGAEPVAVLGQEDAACRALTAELSAAGRHRVLRIALDRPVHDGVQVVEGRLTRSFDLPDDPPGAHAGGAMDLGTVQRLPGRHNWQNAAAAWAACAAFGLDEDDIRRGILSFPGLAHRQQLVASRAGIAFVNDSKATNAEAAVKALVCYAPIYWIIGGLAKAGGLEGTEPGLTNVRHAFAIGAAAAGFGDWLADKGIGCTQCATLERAVAEADAMARADNLPGATVLLSPACASFDQFKSFEQRGERFVQLVRSLPVSSAALNPVGSRP